MMKKIALRCSLFGMLMMAGPAFAQESVYVGELTWTEVRDAVAAGKTTVIIPTGGTEQNGPHMVLGKHNYIIHYTAGEIAKQLGNALVAPVLAYVPEGNYDPPSGHMRMAGTITLPQEHFQAVVEYAARSFKAHGFTDIVLIGDSGGNQRGMGAVAEKLAAEWREEGVGVYLVREYYDRNANGNQQWLINEGHTPDQIGGHAGILDTSQLWAIDEKYVRPDLMRENGGFEGSGVSGNPTKASPEYGRALLQNKIDTAVNRIRQLVPNR